MSHAMRILIAVLSVHSVSGWLLAVDLEQLADRLQADVPGLMQKECVPGLSMVLIRENRIVWKGCFGVRVAGEPAKVDQDTVFEAASMSKPLFTYAVLKLVEAGEFDLDRPLDRYLPKPYAPDQPLAGTITGRMVMLHRTGLPNWREGGWRGGGPLPVSHAPDTCFTYSGEGYLYLQTAIEQLTKQPLAAWMDKSLLVPLNMSRSGFEWDESLATNYAGGHDKQGDFKTGRQFYQQGNAAYSLYTTPADYARFLIEIMKQDRSDGHSLQSDMIERMTTLQVEPEEDNPRSRRSLGWVVDTEQNGRWVYHSGSNGSGFQCNARFDRRRQAGSVIMTNSSNGRKVWEAVLKIIDSASTSRGSASERQAADSPGRITTWGPQSRTIRYEYRLMNPTSEPATRLDIYVPLPLESPRQEIHYLHLPEHRPHQVITDRHGQRLVHYTLDCLEPGARVDLGYVAGITLKNMRWNFEAAAPPAHGSRTETSSPRTPAGAGEIESGELLEPSARTRGGRPPDLTSEARTLYLRSEANYSMESELMRRTAAALVADAATDFERLARIHDHVTSCVRYVRDNRWDPAETVLARGTGSCSEYNYVLSGLCRLAGLPTRCVGGSTNGFRELPTTDTVYHRWTEVFLSGFGWFPVDCSRDANPIRGNRSHFGRVYVDAIVWCHQAGGEDDSLGWDYRAKAHVHGDDPGIRESHRTRWFVAQPEQEVQAAYAWFLEGLGGRPKPDVLECALLRWDEATDENRLKIVSGLAHAGRNECLRWAVLLAEAEQTRETRIRELCASQELADTLLEKSRDLRSFRDWFNGNESRLSPAGRGRFQLTEKGASKATAITTGSSSQIWNDLVPEVVSRLAESLEASEGQAFAIMPVVDQTAAGLGVRARSMLSALKQHVSSELGVQVIDEARFDAWMEEQGPGRGEYWILANGDGQIPPGLRPDFILVPVCISSREADSVLYHLELKTLELDKCKYTQAAAQRRRKAQREEPNELGVLVAAGDTVLARWQHDLVSRQGHEWPLAGLKGPIAAADAAFCNLECCVSLRGSPADKGERCPFYYRARPEMLRCLTHAGIDIVTAANNHGGDYGPESVEDTVTWCETAGLACVGVGEDRAAAEQPRLVNIGPVRVGFAGMDTTMPHFAADEHRPGTNYASEDDDLQVFTDRVKRLGQWAEGRCDLLILTIHWGKNWAREPLPTHRTMARIAFEHGVDLILGHSAHRLQGVEVVDGKAVVYDMGNLLFDCELKPEGQQSALFRLHLSHSGVQKIELLPTQVLEGHTVLAGYDQARQTLSEMVDLCTALGTDVVMDEDLEGRPLGVIQISEPTATVRDPADPNLACVTFPRLGKEIPAVINESSLAGAIPEDARKLSPPVELAPGVQLIAFRLPATAAEGGLLDLSTWWRVTGPVKSHLMPAFHLRPNGETPRRGTPWYTRHDAADWTLPLCLVEPGTVIEDRYPARLAGLPAGRCEVHAVVLDTTRSEGSRIQGPSHLLGTVQIQPRDEDAEGE